MVRQKQITSIRKKIMFQYVTVVFLTLVLIQGSFFVLIHSYYYDGVVKSIDSHVKASSSILDRYTNFTFLVPNTLPSFIRDNFSYEGAELQVINSKNIITTSTSGFNVGKEVLTPDVTSPKDKTGREKYIYRDQLTNEKILALTYPFVYQGTTVAKVRFLTSLDEIDKLLKRIYANSVILGLGVLIIVGGIGLAFAQSLLIPINQFMIASRKIARGNLDIHLNEHYDGELGKLAKTMNYMAREIKKTDQLQHEFISSVSHELRTPLTSIKGWSETMLMGPPPTEEETTQAFTIISNESDRLIELVEGLLDFSSYDVNQTKLNKQKTDIQKLLKDVLSQLKFKARDRGIFFTESFHGQSILEIDEHRLKQVFINVIDNSIKYSHPDSTILVYTDEDEENFYIKIKDTGIGIDKEHLKKVYELFYQANNKKEGMGIGLAVAKQIVDLHGGKLIITSKKGQGTIVSIVLPK